jgi:hypothetical protein
MSSQDRKYNNLCHLIIFIFDYMLAMMHQMGAGRAERITM